LPEHVIVECEEGLTFIDDLCECRICHAFEIAYSSANAGITPAANIDVPPGNPELDEVVGGTFWARPNCRIERVLVFVYR